MRNRCHNNKVTAEHYVGRWTTSHGLFFPSFHPLYLVIFQLSFTQLWTWRALRVNCLLVAIFSYRSPGIFLRSLCRLNYLLFTNLCNITARVLSAKRGLFSIEKFCRKVFNYYSFTCYTVLWLYYMSPLGTAT